MGDVVRVTVEGPVTRAGRREFEVGHFRVYAEHANDPGVSVEVLTPPAPTWWPPQPGDVIRTEGEYGTTWIRDHTRGASTSWRSEFGEITHDAGFLGGWRSVTLIARGGKPVTP